MLCFNCINSQSHCVHYDLLENFPELRRQRVPNMGCQETETSRTDRNAQYDHVSAEQSRERKVTETM